MYCTYSDSPKCCKTLSDSLSSWEGGTPVSVHPPGSAVAKRHCLVLPWQLGCGSTGAWAVPVTSRGARFRWELHEGKKESHFFANIKQSGLLTAGEDQKEKDILRVQCLLQKPSSLFWTWVSTKCTSVDSQCCFSLQLWQYWNVC